MNPNGYRVYLPVRLPCRSSCGRAWVVLRVAAGSSGAGAPAGWSRPPPGWVSGTLGCGSTDRAGGSNPLAGTSASQNPDTVGLDSCANRKYHGCRCPFIRSKSEYKWTLITNCLFVNSISNWQNTQHLGQLVKTVFVNDSILKQIIINLRFQYMKIWFKI